MSRTYKDRPHWVKSNDFARYEMSYYCCHLTQAGKPIYAYNFLPGEKRTLCKTLYSYYYYSNLTGKKVTSTSYLELNKIAHAEKDETGGNLPEIFFQNKHTLSYEDGTPAKKRIIGYNPEICDKNTPNKNRQQKRMCERHAIKVSNTKYWYTDSDSSTEKAQQKKLRNSTRTSMHQSAKLYNSGENLHDIDIKNSETSFTFSQNQIFG